MKKKTHSQQKTARVLAPRGRCPACGSTERTKFVNVQTREISGTCPVTGQPYTHVTWRYCKCVQCGQSRTERTLENRLSSNSPGEQTT